MPDHSEQRVFCRHSLAGLCRQALLLSEVRGESEAPCQHYSALISVHATIEWQAGTKQAGTCPARETHGTLLIVSSIKRVG